MGGPYSKVIVVIIAVSVYVVAVIIMTIALIYSGDENITKTTTSTTKSIHRIIAAKFT